MTNAHSLENVAQTTALHLLPPTEFYLAELLDALRDFLIDHKADNIVTLPLQGKTSIADAMIIASGRSQRHMAALADHLEDFLKDKGITGITIEGQLHSDWVLVDAGAVIIHLFRPEVRAFYNLEKMWSDAFPLQG